MTPIRQGLPDPAAVDPLDDTQQMDRGEMGLAGTLALDAPISPLARTLQLPPDAERIHAAGPEVDIDVDADGGADAELDLSEAAGRAQPLGVIVRRIHVIGG